MIPDVSWFSCLFPLRTRFAIPIPSYWDTDSPGDLPAGNGASVSASWVLNSNCLLGPIPEHQCEHRFVWGVGISNPSDFSSLASFFIDKIGQPCLTLLATGHVCLVLVFSSSSSFVYLLLMYFSYPVKRRKAILAKDSFETLNKIVLINEKYFIRKPRKINNLRCQRCLLTRKKY